MQTPNPPRLARTRAHAREKSLKNFAWFHCVAGTSNGVARSPLSYRSCRRRSWSGWCGNRAADAIVDLGAAASLKTNEQARTEVPLHRRRNRTKRRARKTLLQALSRSSIDYFRRAGGGVAT